MYLPVYMYKETQTGAHVHDTASHTFFMGKDGYKS